VVDVSAKNVLRVFAGIRVAVGVAFALVLIGLKRKVAWERQRHPHDTEFAGS